MKRMRSRVKTGILLAAIALAALLVSGVLYSNHTRKNGFIGVTEDTPAFNVRVLLTALSSYEAEYNSLPPNLSSLGSPSAGKQVSREAANLIDPHLALGTKNGYVYHYVPNTASQSFIITADPSDNGSPSALHYFSDHTAVVRVESGRAATAASQPYQGE